MSGYVIRRAASDGGGFVAKPGGKSSYTQKLEAARVYPSREEAMADCCPENETPISLTNLIS